MAFQAINQFKIGMFMNDEQLLRYNRQIMLSQVDIQGQQQLLDASVLIRGLGGLGCPAALYLAASGIGKLILNDHDQVDLANLQRQIAFNTKDIGRLKVEAARDTLLRLNPQTQIETIATQLHDAELAEQVSNVDVVLDCTDNFSSRFELNIHCVNTSTALVSGAAIRFEGQLAVFTPGKNNSPCYNCLYTNNDDNDEIAETCSESGVISPLPGIIGSMQALEAIKLLACPEPDRQCKILLLDGLSMEWQTMKLNRNPQCPTCG
ncbi:MAG: molybdopterin-synthase adenylyltransferase MoeB [Methylococcales bacterium]